MRYARTMNVLNPVRLTQTVQKGGCAAKVSADELRAALSKISMDNGDPNVLVDGRNFDDAGIYRITDELALVQTLDFFTPIVDTPLKFGEIAAANALSDVYAMGGQPKTAMAILAFPMSTLDSSILTEIMQGAQNKVKESGATILGGHSIDDDTIKFGLSVTGLVDPRKTWTNAGARPGDQLILTKPLGTGTLCAGLKNGDYTENQIDEALQSMAQLNAIRDLFEASHPDWLSHIHAATDITGFGLAGHSVQLARASKFDLHLDFQKLPMFSMALASLEADNLTRAHRTNRDYTKNEIVWNHRPANSIHEALVFDPQTSGGLLLSVSASIAGPLLESLKKRFNKAEIIGSVDTATSAPRVCID